MNNIENFVSIEDGVASIDTCTISNLAAYKDAVLKGTVSKLDKNFVDEYSKLYDVLKNKAGKVVLTMITQVEIAKAYQTFLSIMRVVDDLNCELKPFPILGLLDQMEHFFKPKNDDDISKLMEVFAGKTDAKKEVESYLKDRDFLKPMIEKFKKEAEKVDPDDAYYFQNVASILSLIYRGKNETNNRMMAVKDMFDAIMLAENKIYGIDYFFTSNKNDYTKCLSISYSDVIKNGKKIQTNDIVTYFKEKLIPILYEKYTKKYTETNRKNMQEFFTKGIKNTVDDHDLFILKTVLEQSDVEDEEYKRFKETLAKTIHAERGELKVSKIKREEKFFDFVNELSPEDCESMITLLWHSTIEQKLSDNSTLIEKIYKIQGIHEKHDTLEKTKAREKTIEELFGITNLETLMESLIKALLRYQEEGNKQTANTKVEIVSIKK